MPFQDEIISLAAREGTTTSPTFIDAFAGCGGLSLGLKRAGWKGVLAIEKDPFAFDTLASNFPRGTSSMSYDWPEEIEMHPWDLRTLLVEKQEQMLKLRGRIDLLAGGPPCQGFSHAGRRRQDDPRNRLFEAYLELVSVISPRIVLLENVRGFTSDFKDTQEGEIQNFSRELIRRLSEKYAISSSIILASDYGVPQMRPRFFLVGIKKGDPSCQDLPNFFKRLAQESAGFLAEKGLPRFPTARDAISDLEVGINGTVACEECSGFQAIAYKAPRTPYQKVMRQGANGAPTDTRLARHRPDIRNRFEAIIKACHEEGRLNTAISRETREAHNLKKMAIRVMDALNPSPTITSLPDDLLHYSEPRTLTVRENARLQSFPDWFVFKGKYTTGGDRRTREVPRFTQVANAVPPLLAEQIGLVLWRFATSQVIDMSLKSRANGT